MDALRNIRDYLRLLSRLRAQNSVGADDVDYEEEKVEAPTSIDTSGIQGNDINMIIARSTGMASMGRPANTRRVLWRRSINPSQNQHQQQVYKTALTQKYVPNKLVALYQHDARVFCGKYSTDGEVFMSASQDRLLKLYNTQGTQYKCFKTIHCRHVGWAVLDTDYSPDSRFLVYSTWSPYVQLCNIYGDYELHEALDFEPDGGRFSLFSVEFSQDNRELVGGSNDAHVYLYDIETKRRVLRFVAHTDDVNTVTFADPQANIILSGSDDGLCKAWDRRTLRSSGSDSPSSGTQKPVGSFTGHHQGITFIDSKGDGRYFISNGKDQCIKLWDMRTMSDKIERPRLSSWDYRMGFTSGGLYNRFHSKLENDSSIMTYRGHRVFSTLIRCRFSPMVSTGQRYIYTGSGCGSVYVYDLLTGETVSRILGQEATVRDVSWHPHLPEITSSSWDGTCARFRYQPSLSAGTADDLEHDVLEQPVEATNSSSVVDSASEDDSEDDDAQDEAPNSGSPPHTPT